MACVSEFMDPPKRMLKVTRAKETYRGHRRNEAKKIYRLIKRARARSPG